MIFVSNFDVCKIYTVNAVLCLEVLTYKSSKLEHIFFANLFLNFSCLLDIYLSISICSSSIYSLIRFHIKLRNRMPIFLEKHTHTKFMFNNSTI